MGASTDQAQVAIAHEVIRIVQAFRATGEVPNVVNRLARSSATHVLVDPAPQPSRRAGARVRGAGRRGDQRRRGGEHHLPRRPGHAGADPPRRRAGATARWSRIRSGNPDIISVELSEIDGRLENNRLTTTASHNFSAGPAVLPEPVLRKAQEAIWNVAGSGIGIMEHSHRGKVFDRILDEAEQACRELAGIPDDYAVLFLQGGASLQFSMVPMNLLPADRTADYLITGVWSQKAVKEAKILGGKVHIAASSEATNFDRIPKAGRDRVLRQPGLRAPHHQQHDLRHPVAERARGARRRSAGGRHLERHVQPADRRRGSTA